MNKIFSEQYVAVISLFWVLLMICLVILKRQTLNILELNSIGDFLAGAFAPLGFFWIVAGYKQNSESLELQSVELVNSTKALNDQVEEQKKLFLATEQQIKLSKDKNDFEIFSQKKQFQPFFHIDELKIHTWFFKNSDSMISFEIQFKLYNSRETCRNLFFGYNYENELSPDFIVEKFSIPLLTDSIEQVPVLLNIKNLPPVYDEDDKFRMILRFTYTDALDIIQYQCVNLTIKKSLGTLRVDHLSMGNQTLK